MMAGELLGVTKVLHQDGWVSQHLLQTVIPAKAGIQRLQSHVAIRPWMPAFAGMT
ncbi:hypothetical protein bcgnr5380_62170 [Bacillus cereus]